MGALEEGVFGPVLEPADHHLGVLLNLPLGVVLQHHPPGDLPVAGYGPYQEDVFAHVLAAPPGAVLHLGHHGAWDNCPALNHGN